MERKTLRTILLVVGSGIGGILIFVVATIAFISYRFSDGRVSLPMSQPREEMVSAAPPLVEAERFWGSHGVTVGDFAKVRNKVLDSGEGKIIGFITSNGNPIKGLRLRLALNGGVMSTWGETDSDGKYQISLPYGQYRIDGYELNSDLANTLLKGKTDNPRNAHRSEIMAISKESDGIGLRLDFVDPVRKKGPRGVIPSSKPIVLTWEPYPNAKSYRIQVIERKAPRDLMGERQLFEWRQRPVVSGTSMVLSDYGAAVEAGNYYTVQIEALDSSDNGLADSPRYLHQPDFQVVK